ncbi:DUF1735 domain-containing protein [Labilibacter marinus]|uniref:DUF1735 domain-containing protein n=1 Tax=Labilibacter marinus TaxID=1477105 RepID=UPI00094F75CE|nr:DUF1735 domain-containing protein [Labilibacter marinus]
MKKLILFSFMLVLVMTSCYDDYKGDFDYTGTYFAYQYPARTFIVDTDEEDIKFKVGVTLGGKYSYEGVSETVYFMIEDTLITNNDGFKDVITPMPTNWYTLSSESEFKISNSNVGFIDVTIKRDSLIKYPEASGNKYALPFLITEATTDSVLDNRQYSILVVKFKNQFDGRYIIKGADVSFNLDGTPKDTIVYNDPDGIRDYVFLNTIAKDKLNVPRVGFTNGINYTMQFNEDGSSVLMPAEGSEVSELVGASTYDFKTRTFISKYEYTINGTDHLVADTLIYSNTELTLESWN